MCAVIFWKVTLMLPMPLILLLEHKNADYVLEKAENGGSRPQKRTKSPFLCSKGLKMRVFEGKSAQKCQFCAREGGFWSSERKFWYAECYVQ